MEANDTPDEEPEMTNHATILLKTISATIEASDLDDPKDAEQAIRLIRTLLASDEKPAK